MTLARLCLDDHFCAVRQFQFNPCHNAGLPRCFEDGHEIGLAVPGTASRHRKNLYLLKPSPLINFSTGCSLFGLGFL
jgi:hypothetical protein